MEEIIHLINEMSPYLLLGFLLAGLMHTFIPGEYFTKYLSKKNFMSVINAALLGIPLPLCSCGVLPTAMSLRKEGASKGAVASFLISTPQTGVDSIIVTYSLMGLPFAIIRPIAAMVTAVFGGAMVNAGDKHCEEKHENSCCCHEHEHHDSCCHNEEKHCCCHHEEEHEHDCCCHHEHTNHRENHFIDKIKEALNYAFIEMMEDIGKWLVVGLVVAGLITVFVPDDLFAYFNGNTFASMLLVLVIALPMYVCATGSIPIAVALMMKGLTPGAGLVLLMAGPACNFASMILISKSLGKRILSIYLASIIIGSVAFGYLIDYLQFSGTVDFLSNLTYQKECCSEGSSYFSWFCTGVLLALIIYAVVLPKLGLRKKHCCEHCH